MRILKALIAVIVLAVSGYAATNATLAGNIVNLVGSANAATVTVTLSNFGGYLPKTSDGALGATALTINIASGGTYSQALYSTPQITPSTTFYTFQVNGANGQVIQFFAATVPAGTTALENLVQISPQNATPPISSAYPVGPAGGALTGTFPNPTLAVPLPNSDLTGSGTATVNGQSCALGSSCTVPAAGAAGGFLNGSYPNPGVVTPIPNSDLTGTGAATVNGQSCSLGGTCTVTAAPSGTAGGALGGSYPNPTVSPFAGPRPWIDVTATGYAADPTGTSDSTTAFTTADSNCASGTVFVPDGTYLLSTWNPTTACTFINWGGGAILLRNSGTTTATQTVGWIQIGTSNFQLINFTINGNNGVWGGNGIVAAGNFSNIYLVHNTIENMDGAGITFAGASTGSLGPTNSRILYNTITNTMVNAGLSYGPIYIRDGSNNVLIQGNRIDGSNTLGAGAASIQCQNQGLTGLGIQNLQIIGNSIANAADWGLQCGGFNGPSSQGMQIVGNYFEALRKSVGFMSIYGTNGAVVAGNQGNDHYLDLMYSGTDGVTNGTTTFTSASGAFTSGMTGRTLVCDVCGVGGAPLVTTVTYSSSTTLTLATAATNTASGLTWHLYGYSISLACIEVAGGTGDSITGNTFYAEGSGGSYCIDVDGGNGSQITGNQVIGFGEAGGVGIILQSALPSQPIASITDTGSLATVTTSSATGCTANQLCPEWQPGITAAICGGISITSFTGTSGTLTFTNTGVNGLQAGSASLFGFTGGNTGLNGQQITVLSAGLTSTTFEAAVTGSGYSSGAGFAAPGCAAPSANSYYGVFTISNSGYSRIGQTFSYNDVTGTNLATCSTNCGNVVMSISNINVDGNSVYMPSANPTSGNVWGMQVKTATAAAQYAFSNTFSHNHVFGTGPVSAGTSAGMDVSGSANTLDSTTWIENTIINAAICFDRNFGTNTRWIRNICNGDAVIAAGSAQAGEVIEWAQPTGAPSCTFASGGGTSPSCALDTGSMNASGTIILSTGTGSPAASGSLTLTFGGTFGANKPDCFYEASNKGGSSWSTLPVFTDSNPSTASDTALWINGTSNAAATALTASTTYWVNYQCLPK